MKWGNSALSSPDLQFDGTTRSATSDEVVTRIDLGNLFEAGAVEASFEPRIRSLNQILPECHVAVLSYVNATRRVLAILGSSDVDAVVLTELRTLVERPDGLSSLRLKPDGVAVFATGRLSSFGTGVGTGERRGEANRVLFFSHEICAATTAVIVVWRESSFGQFHESEIEAITNFTEATFATLRLRAAHDEQILTKISGMLDTLNLALIVGSDLGTVLRTNDCGRELLAAGGYFVDGESLQLKDAALDGRFRRLVSDMMSGRESISAVLPIRRDGTGMLAKCAVMVLRTSRDSLVGIPMFAIVTQAVKGASSIGVEQLQKMSFTRAEAELTVQLLAGRTVSEYARMRQLAVPTVRAHLKRVMMRVGVHRQADLVRVLLNTFQ